MSSMKIHLFTENVKQRIYAVYSEYKNDITKAFTLSPLKIYFSKVYHSKQQLSTRFSPSAFL